MAARTALRLAALHAGERVLVVGATGGVGTALLPMLRAAGVEATATARAPEGAAVVRRLGADHVIGVEAEHYPDDFDAVFNLELAPAARAHRSGGRLVSAVVPVPDPVDLDRDDVEIRLVADL